MEESLSSPAPQRLRWYWSLLYVVAVFAVLVPLGFGLSLLGLDMRSPRGLIATIALSAVVMGGLALLLTHLLELPIRPSLRLGTASPADTITACAGIAGLGLAVDELLGRLSAKWPTVFDDEALRFFFDAFATATPVEGVALAVAIAVLPGVSEELGFRGFVMRSLEDRLPVWAAILMSAVLFGVVHGSLLQGSGAAILGVYLGLVAWRTDSLLPAMAAHATNNLVSAISALQHPLGAPLFEPRPLWMPLAGLAIGVIAVVRLGGEPTASR